MPRQNMIKTLSQLLTIAPSLSPQVTHLKDPDMFWDFISLMPMTTHQVRLFLDCCFITLHCSIIRFPSYSLIVEPLMATDS